MYLFEEPFAQPYLINPMAYRIDVMLGPPPLQGV